jgi:hypothetical protein
LNRCHVVTGFAQDVIVVGCASKRHRVTNRFRGHWLHGLWSDVKASIDGGVITTSELDLRAAFGRVFFAKRLPGPARDRRALRFYTAKTQLRTLDLKFGLDERAIWCDQYCAAVRVLMAVGVASSFRKLAWLKLTM